MSTVKTPIKADEIREILAQHYCTENYHQYLFLLLTDGALEMAQTCDAFWLLDIILSYQVYKKIRLEPFQVWKLTLDGADKTSAFVVCTDGNDRQLVKQYIDYTDFPLPEGMVLWKEGNVILLPREH
jgi:hypothetical protein